VDALTPRCASAARVSNRRLSVASSGLVQRAEAVHSDSEMVPTVMCRRARKVSGPAGRFGRWPSLLAPTVYSLRHRLAEMKSSRPSMATLMCWPDPSSLRGDKAAATACAVMTEVVFVCDDGSYHLRPSLSRLGLHIVEADSPDDGIVNAFSA